MDGWKDGWMEGGTAEGEDRQVEDWRERKEGRKKTERSSKAQQSDEREALARGSRAGLGGGERLRALSALPFQAIECET